MNDNAKLWVQDLESGKYEQTRSALRVGDTFCCLGVLCERYRLETGEGEWDQGRSIIGDPVLNFRIGRDKETGSTIPYGAGLPPEVRDWAGLSDSLGVYTDDPGLPRSEGLAWKNDRGASFQEIADIIKSEPLDLFKDESTLTW